MINKKDLTKYVSAFLYGDGHLAMSTGSVNAHYVLHQKKSHEDYVLWQAELLETLTKVRVRYKEQYITSQGAIAKESIRIESMNHPFYTTLWNRWYLNRVKVISPHDLKLLDWETMAIFYQDDGYIEITPRETMEHYVRVRICSENYSYGDLLLLTRAIKEKLGIPFDIVQRKLTNSMGYRLQITKDNAKRFIAGVTPYIKPSYYYKIDLSLISNERTHLLAVDEI